MSAYKEILIAMAEGKQIEYLNPSYDWKKVPYSLVYTWMSQNFAPERLRAASKTITINGVDISAPADGGKFVFEMKCGNRSVKAYFETEKAANTLYDEIKKTLTI